MKTIISIGIPRSFGTREKSYEHASKLLGEPSFFLFVTTHHRQDHSNEKTYNSTFDIQLDLWLQNRAEIRELIRRLLDDDLVSGPLTVSTFPNDGSGLVAAITADTIGRLSAFDEFAQERLDSAQKMP